MQAPLHNSTTCPVVTTEDQWQLFCQSEDGDESHRYELAVAPYNAEREREAKLRRRAAR